MARHVPMELQQIKTLRAKCLTGGFFCGAGAPVRNYYSNTPTYTSKNITGAIKRG
jgi:hypothetical protein